MNSKFIGKVKEIGIDFEKITENDLVVLTDYYYELIDHCNELTEDNREAGEKFICDNFDAILEECKAVYNSIQKYVQECQKKSNFEKNPKVFIAIRYYRIIYRTLKAMQSMLYEFFGHKIKLEVQQIDELSLWLNLTILRERHNFFEDLVVEKTQKSPKYASDLELQIASIIKWNVNPFEASKIINQTINKDASELPEIEKWGLARDIIYSFSIGKKVPIGQHYKDLKIFHRFCNDLLSYIDKKDQGQVRRKHKVKNIRQTQENLLWLFKGNEELKNKFITIAKSTILEAMDKECNWVFDGNIGCIVDCFKALEDFGITKKIIDRHGGKSKLARAIQSKINSPSKDLRKLISDRKIDPNIYSRFRFIFTKHLKNS